MSQMSAAVEKDPVRFTHQKKKVVLLLLLLVMLLRQLSQSHTIEDCRTTLTFLLTDSDTTKTFLPVSLIANYLGLSAVKEVWQSAP